jgi:hypothetical protein
MVCKKCKVVLGLRCESAPEGHLLMKQVLPPLTLISDSEFITDVKQKPAHIEIV